MTVGVIHFVSEMLRGTQMADGIIHFMSEMLRGTHIKLQSQLQKRGRAGAV